MVLDSFGQKEKKKKKGKKEKRKIYIFRNSWLRQRDKLKVTIKFSDFVGFSANFSSFSFLRVKFIMRTASNYWPKKYPLYFGI